MVEDGYIQRGVLQALNPLSNRVTFIAIVPRAYNQGKAKCGKKTLKTLIYFTTRTRHRYNNRYISEMVEDRWVYMVRCV